MVEVWSSHSMILLRSHLPFQPSEYRSTRISKDFVACNANHDRTLLAT
jgi:hypothetical protein